MIDADLKRVSMFIHGMSCEVCVAHVEMVLKRVPGVREITVNLVNRKVMVEYDSFQASFGKMISALEERGYRVSGFTCRDLEIPQEYLPLEIGKVKR